MKTDIILSGVGGQGIITIAAIIATAALQNNMFIKQSEVHGMSQRGGAVQSHLRISEGEIASDLIPQGKADIIISVEPMEGLRYLPFLSAKGWLVTNTAPFENISNYPDLKVIMNEIEAVGKFVALDADLIAKELKSTRSSNIVMLGAASPFIHLSPKILEKAITTIFERKGEDVVAVNIQAFRLGKEHAEKMVKHVI